MMQVSEAAFIIIFLYYGKNYFRLSADELQTQRLCRVLSDLL